MSIGEIVIIAIIILCALFMIIGIIVGAGCALLCVLDGLGIEIKRKDE